MSERKKQIWFRPDQAELTIECLKYVKGRCSENNALDDGAARLGKRFVVRRIDEILKMFEEKS